MICYSLEEQAQNLKEVIKGKTYAKSHIFSNDLLHSSFHLQPFECGGAGTGRSSEEKQFQSRDF
jgi:hypothetical protein